MKSSELLDVVIAIGERLTYCGAEIYRVEESINRICAAYGHDSAEVFAIPASLVVTVYGDDGSAATRSVRIPDVSANLGKVGEYNALCRRICEEKPDYTAIMKELENIESSPEYGTGVRLIGYMLVGFSFSFFFGGNSVSALLAAAAAGIVFFITEIADSFGAGMFLRKVLCSAAAALFSAIVCGHGYADIRDTVTVSALMTMVPGVSITNGMRDFISGDLLAGLYTMAEAFTAAVAMAVGAGSVMSFLGA